ncbi:glycosyltransferase [Zhihengliuella sp.]|uniref:glycosyltransferase n=1 Tax=Zhihengliuella sp. TaxID=1954483 RepID=UPI002811D422|nr:glycosyltransferase [Zhihengliuella sp.]
MRKRVLFVDHSSELGGGQLGLLRYLAQPSQFERSVVVLGEGEFATRVKALGLHIEVLPGVETHADKVKRARSLQSAVRAMNAEIVVTNSLPAANILGLTRDTEQLRIAYLREDLSRSSLPGTLKRFAMFRHTLARFDGYLANSAFTASTLPRGLKGRPVEVAYPVSGTGRTDAPEFPEGAFTIGSLSRLDHSKGLHVLVEAIERLVDEGRDVRAIIAGGSAHADPRYAEDIRRVVRDRGLPIEFLGHVDDVRAVLEKSHVLALCTLRPEAFGQVMVQAMAAGRPVIATAMGGPVEVLGPSRAGVLVPPGDAESLARAIGGLDDDREGVRAMGRRGCTEALRFTDEITSRGLDDGISALARAIKVERSRG